MNRRTLLASAFAASFIPALPFTSALAQQGSSIMTAPASSGFAPVNGVEVYYATYGSGEPLVLLHGGLGQIEMFGALIDRFAATRTVIGIDLQAHGRTPAMARPMSFADMATDVAGIIRHLGYDRADIVGYSMGGGVALTLGLDHPEVVDRLVVLSAPFAYAGWHDYNRDGMRAISSALTEQMKPSPMYQMFAAVNPDPERNFPILLDKMGAFIGNDYDYSGRIPSLAAPTMLVYGDWDAVRTAHVAQFFELLGGGRQDALWDGSGMNRNRLAILPGVTHYTMLEAPGLAEIVLRFLAR